MSTKIPGMVHQGLLAPQGLCTLHTFVHSWNIVTVYGHQKNFQNATRVVSGGIKLYSMDKLFRELAWEPLQSRRNKHKLVTFYNVLHGLARSYLFDLVPPQINETNDHPLRNADHIQNF